MIEGRWLQGADTALVGQKEYEAANPHLNEETKP